MSLSGPPTLRIWKRRKSATRLPSVTCSCGMSRYFQGLAHIVAARSDACRHHSGPACALAALHLAANSASSAFRANRLSPSIGRLSNRSSSDNRRFAWQLRGESSSNIRGSSRGRWSLPIQVSFSFCCFVTKKVLKEESVPTCLRWSPFVDDIERAIHKGFQFGR